MNFIALRARYVPEEGDPQFPDTRFFSRARGFQCVEGCREQYWFYVPNNVEVGFVEPHRRLARAILREQHHPRHPKSFEIPFDPSLSF